MNVRDCVSRFMQLLIECIEITASHASALLVAKVEYLARTKQVQMDAAAVAA